MAVFGSYKPINHNDQGFTPASPGSYLRIFQLPRLGRDQQQRPGPTQSLDYLPTNVYRSLRPYDMDRSEIQLITTSVDREKLEKLIAVCDLLDIDLNGLTR